MSLADGVRVRPFRVGLMVTRPPRDAAGWRALARTTEAQGFDVLQLPNHMANQPLAPLVALAVAAEATSTLRVGTLVLDNELVHPAVIANEAATVDLMSEGRLELGIGAGWLAADHELIGQPWASAGERIERLAEAVAVLKACFTQASASFEGKHYRVSGLPALPRPVQQPHPPILIGGGGRKVLTLAAQVADIVSLVPNMAAGKVGADSARTATGEATRQKLAWVREAAGARLGELELHANLTYVRITDDRTSALAKVAGVYGLGDDVIAAADVPHAAVGTVEQIAQTLLARRDELGISYVTVFDTSVAAMVPVLEHLRG